MSSTEETLEVERARAQIVAIIEEIQRLAGGNTSEAEFFGGLLDRALAAMEAVGGLVWLLGEGGRVEPVCHAGVDRVGIAGVQCTIDGLKQIGQFATGDGPDLMRVLDVFVVEVVRQSVVPLAVGGGQGLTLVGLQARPKDRGQRGMEAKKRRPDARNALGFDQGRRFQLPTQAGPDRGVSFQLAILDFGRLEACFNLHDG